MEERRGEISVRRAMGGSGWRILAQNIGEIWAVTAAAALIACVVVINIIVMGKMNIVGETDQFMLPVTRELYPLLFDPVLHFLMVGGYCPGTALRNGDGGSCCAGAAGTAPASRRRS